MSENIKEVSMQTTQKYRWTDEFYIVCPNCGYRGDAVYIEKPDPANPDSTIFEPGCPNCRTDQNVEIYPTGEE